MELSIQPLFFLLICYCLSVISGSSIYHEEDDHYMHPYLESRGDVRQINQYETAESWRNNAQEELKRRAQSKPIVGQARNVIFYLGDGMSVPTVTAARILKGQKVDNSLNGGEEASLHMDTFSYIGASKTYCVDAQVADSACSATAYLGGVKGNTGTIGVNSNVKLRNCTAQINEANHVSSALAWAQVEGKSTGIVTTTRVTHASPAGTYAHIAHRDWENDAFMANDQGLQDPSPQCIDIAKQLITREPGRNINVILGGGRREFLTDNDTDPEYSNTTGERRDENLINTWLRTREEDNQSHRFVWNKDQLLAAADQDYLLGLFEPSHVSYLDLQAANNDPSLEEMVEVAITILSRNPKGFFLFVEGGRIDHAHHDNLIRRSLWETIEFDKAIEKGDSLTSDQDTLLVVTSDHAHVMYMAGYPDRGTPIFSHPSALADDGLPYPTLGYGNGPGQPFIDPETGRRHNVSTDDLNDPTIQVRTPILLDSETHGGDDVLIFAKGPFAHLLTGVHEQSYIPHVVGYAACMGNGLKYCN